MPPESVFASRSAASARSKRSSSSSRAARVRARHALDAPRQHEVLAGGGHRVARRLLRRRGRSRRAPARARAATSMPATRALPRVGARQRGEDLHGGRLAGAVGPEQREHAAGGDLERQAVERRDVPVGLARGRPRRRRARLRVIGTPVVREPGRAPMVASAPRVGRRSGSGVRPRPVFPHRPGASSWLEQLAPSSPRWRTGSARSPRSGCRRRAAGAARRHTSVPGSVRRGCRRKRVTNSSSASSMLPRYSPSTRNSVGKPALGRRAWPRSPRSAAARRAPRAAAPPRRAAARPSATARPRAR